jgi:hypothetical protein
MHLRKDLFILFVFVLVWCVHAQSRDWDSYFDCEGIHPVKNGYLEFSALASKVLTSNGHGLRNELKRKTQDRTEMYKTSEMLSGSISYELSRGAKTIVVQYHEGDTNTLFKLYIADIEDPRLQNGKARDGIFDIFARIDDLEGEEVIFPLSMISGNGRFEFSLENKFGEITLNVNGTSIMQKTKNSKGVYLKFGDYLQAQDPVTGKQEEHSMIPSFYERNSITIDRIVFENLKYERREKANSHHN